MSGLETAYYIISIVFMSLMLIITIGIAVAVLVIRAKINAIHDHVEERLGKVTEWAEKGGAVLGALKKVAKVSKK